jgi:hypothetical protein
MLPREIEGMTVACLYVSTVRKALETLPASTLQLRVSGPIGSQEGAACPVLPGLCHPRDDFATYLDLLAALGLLEKVLDKWIAGGPIGPGDFPQSVTPTR